MGVVSGLGPTYDVADGSLRAIRATSGDYSAVEQFLCVDLRRICTTDFHEQFESSGTPSDQRLLLKRSQQIVGHVLLRFRDVHWGKSHIATCRFGPLDLLPEYRSPWVIAAMLEAIEHVGLKEVVEKDENGLEFTVKLPGFATQCLGPSSIKSLHYKT